MVSYLLQAIILERWHGSFLIRYIAAYLTLAYVRKKSNLSVALLFVFKIEQEKNSNQCLPSQKGNFMGNRHFAVNAASESSLNYSYQTIALFLHWFLKRNMCFLVMRDIDNY